MKKSLLITFDTLATFILFPFFYVIGIFKIFFPMTNKKLIIRPGGMGDLVCLTMSIRQLGYSFSDYCFLIEKRSEPWAKYLGLNYYCYDSLSVISCYLKNYQAVYNSEQKYGLSGLIVALFYRSSKTFCFNTNKCNYFCKEVFLYDSQVKHEVESFIDLLGKKQAPLRTKRLKKSSGYQIFYLAGSESKARDIEPGVLVPLIAKYLHPDQELYLISAPNEKVKLKKIGDLLPQKFNYFENNFEKSIEFLENADQVITIDGGSVHLCSFLGIPTTAIFTNGNSKKWLPLAENSRILLDTKMQCAPCVCFGVTPECKVGYKCNLLQNLEEINNHEL
jgi:ADP-heptose:LPS heptosyltransferase